MASDANGYQWLLNDAAITGATNNSYDAGEAGNYKVVINTINGCADASDAITIIVLPSPEATVTTNGPTSFCPGGQVQLSAMPDANAYQWYMDGTAIPLENNQSYIASQSGTYTVKVSMANGCSAVTPAGSAAVVVQYPFPNPSITADGPTNLCEGNSVLMPMAAWLIHRLFPVHFISGSMPAVIATATGFRMVLRSLRESPARIQMATAFPIMRIPTATTTALPTALKKAPAG